MAKTTAHIRYRNKENIIIPGVTTVLNAVLAKPALLEWAYQCGLAGIDYRAARDQAGDIGTIAHGMIMSHLTGQAFDKTDYSEKDIGQAENALIKYWDWEKEKTVKPVLVEMPLVSELYQYGGTVDCLAEVNGDLILIDFKTGKGIYPEMFSQVAAYRQLLDESGHVIKEARILRIGRDDQEGFEERVIGNLDKYMQLFLHALGIYKLQKELK